MAQYLCKNAVFVQKSVATWHVTNNEMTSK